MPAKFKQRKSAGAPSCWATYKKASRAFEIITETVRAGRKDKLVPKFRAFFEFCRARMLEPRALQFLDSVRAIANSLGIRGE